MIVIDETPSAADDVAFQSSKHRAAVGEFLLEVFQRFFNLNYASKRVGAGKTNWRDIFSHIEARDVDRRAAMWTLLKQNLLAPTIRVGPAVCSLIKLALFKLQVSILQFTSKDSSMFWPEFAALGGNQVSESRSSSLTP